MGSQQPDHVHPATLQREEIHRIEHGVKVREVLKSNFTSQSYVPALIHPETLPEAQRTQGTASKLELSLQLMVAPLALVPNLTTRWRHLHELKNWPQDGATCISCMS